MKKVSISTKIRKLLKYCFNALLQNFVTMKKEITSTSSKFVECQINNLNRTMKGHGYKIMDSTCFK